VHRQPRVDHGVHEQDVPVRDLGVEVLQEPDALVAFAVPGELQEVKRMQGVDGSRQVADEGDARFERPDQQRLPARVVLLDRGADLANPRPDLLRVEEDLADPVVGFERRSRGQNAQDAFCSPNRAASRSKSRS
jgi:hypothetical protein